MNIRPKTIRRLFILFAAATFLGGLIASWLLVSQRRIAARVAAVRETAVAAYKIGSYSAAAASFSDFFTRSHSQDSDPEAVFDYADSLSRLAVEPSRHRY